MKISIITAIALLLGTSVQGQIITNYTTTDGLLANNVLCVDVDQSNNIWFGTQDGISVFDGVAWSSYTTSDGLVDNTIQAIFIDNSNDCWVGTDFGISKFDGPGWNSYTTADGLGSNQIKCITQDLAGNMWFGTNNGASRYDGATFTNFGTAQGLPFGGVNEIEILANGDVWMGTGLSGVSIYNGTTFTTINAANDGLIDNRVRSIAVDATNIKWIGTSEGISVFNSGNTFSLNHTTMFSLPAPDTLNPIEDIEMDSQGNFWVGVYVDYLVTEGGVCAYNGNNWNQYKVADGLVGPVVRALTVDGNDDVWVATSTGVSKISDPSVGIHKLEESAFSIYPNPANDQFTIRVPNDLLTSEIVIYSANMQIVKKETVQSELTQFSVGDLSTGIYFVQIGTTVQRLVIR